MDAVLLDKVAGYTQKFVDAAIPIAKKAYEIGLLTLRIDALAVLIPSLVVLIATVVILIWGNNKCNAAQEKFKKDYGHSDFDISVGHALTWLACTIISVICAINLIQVWTWVKLFAPDLWLAHAAIQKLTGG